MRQKVQIACFLFSLVTLLLHFNSFSQDYSEGVEGDRRALMDLYEATGGTGWANDSGWGSGNPSGSWYGIEVNGNGRVVRVDLRGNNLSGNLPETLGNLTKVQYFNVKQNRLSGELPWSGIGNMISLRHLLLNGRTVDPDPASSAHHPGKDLSGSYSDERTNDFTGQMGAEVGNLSNLEQLELMGVNSEHTGLTGAVPEEIGNLTNLEGLYLDFNSFSSFPSTMGNLTNLYQFGMNNNGLEGTLPSWIGNWTKLRFLWFEDNNFTGSIPDLSNLVNLEIFVAKKNNFSGEIPGWMFDGTLPNINLVDLAWNGFTGTLPEFGKPNNLKALQVDGNDLTGEVPTSVSNIANIKNFGLGWNQLEGEIPDLSHMHQLRYLRANDNNFTGDPPMVDTTNEDLQFIDLRNNQMSGEIPVKLADLADLPQFQEFNISNNQFSETDLKTFLDTLKDKGRLDIFVYE